MVDPKMQPISEVIQAIKKQKYKIKIDENDIIENEVQDPKSLGINLNILAECQKST